MPASEGRHLLIHGRVQGVGFRHATTLEARRLGLCGWVRNRSDGRVEALIAGPAEAVAHLLVWAQHGPPLARVDQLEVELADASLTAAAMTSGIFEPRADA
jgi:acylphosphatase